MRKTFSHPTLRVALSGFAAALILIVGSSTAAGSAATSFTFVPEFFDGGGSGSTPETAVQSAIWDAENTASGYGLLTCELVGEAAVFPQPPGSPRAFSAQVQLHCTP
jgi:hypothetical protein